MGKFRKLFINFASLFGIFIIIASYYYITILSIGGIPTFSVTDYYSKILGSAQNEDKLRENNPNVHWHKQALTKPINITENDFLLFNAKKCRAVRHHRAKKVVLFLVTTMSKNYKAREQLRLSWAIPDIDEDIRFEAVYIMGVPKTALWQDARVWHNEFGELSRESEDHRDMVLIDYIEDYKNISFKVAAGLFWSKKWCHDVDYIIQVHDDVMIRRDQLIPYLWDLPLKNFIGGDCDHTRKPVRDENSKLFVDKNDYHHDVYPPYCYGSAVVMTADVRDKLLEQTYKTNYFMRDDVYLGMLMKDAGLEPVKMPRVKHEVKNMHYCTVKGLIMLQPVPLPKQQQLKEEFEEFEDKNKKCKDEL